MTRTVVLTTLALIAGGCGAGGPDPLAAPPVAASAVVVADDEFAPAAVEVPAGTSVTWTWEGGNAHNVSGDGFTSDTQDEGTFTHAFDAPGTYAYRCTLHPGMTGAVVVSG